MDAVTLGLFIVFATAVFFSAACEATGIVEFCAFAWICWWSLALYWLYLVSDVRFMGFLPFGIGWLYLARLFLDLLNLPFLRRRRRVSFD